MNEPDTIAAPATAPGEAAISVLRISGPNALSVADQVFDGPAPKPSARAGGTFVHGVIRDKAGHRVDDVVLLIMRAPRSYTGEDVVEIQGHGGVVAPRLVFRTCLDAGCRAAEPGEFTRRAFLNGKLDLLQVEAVVDLIRARSERAASAALEQMEGALTQELNEISDKILHAAVTVEAGLDFPEEEIPPITLSDLHTPLRDIENAIDEKLRGWDEGRLLREGARVVVLGRPNVGKSTLFNALLGHDRAIVTSHPGTTRDTLEEGLVLGGIPIRLIDTAGLRDTACPVEREGIDRTRRHAPAADVLVHILDASQPPDQEDRALWENRDNARIVVVLNKTDLGSCAASCVPQGLTTVQTRLDIGRGLPDIRGAIRSVLETMAGSPVEPHAVISERHRAILVSVKTDISEAGILALEGQEDMCVPAAARLRSALEQMGKLTGRVYHDDLLDGIFERFCIGK